MNLRHLQSFRYFYHLQHVHPNPLLATRSLFFFFFLPPIVAPLLLPVVRASAKAPVLIFGRGAPRIVRPSGVRVIPEITLVNPSSSTWRVQLPQRRWLMDYVGRFPHWMCCLFWFFFGGELVLLCFFKHLSFLSGGIEERAKKDSANMWFHVNHLWFTI